jgi:hypothetical protein
LTEGIKAFYNKLRFLNLNQFEKGGEKDKMFGSLMTFPVLLAEDINITPQGDFSNLANISIGGIVSAGVTLILIIAALVSFVFLIIGGIRWMTSAGDKEGTSKAQSTITSALIGLVIVFSAWAIIKLLQTFFGLPNIFEFNIPQISG